MGAYTVIALESPFLVFSLLHDVRKLIPQNIKLAQRFPTLLFFRAFFTCRIRATTQRERKTKIEWERLDAQRTRITYGSHSISWIAVLGSETQRPQIQQQLIAFCASESDKQRIDVRDLINLTFRAGAS